MNKLYNILDLMRLNKLSRHTGYMLIFLPCAMGTGLYGNWHNDYKTILLFLIGSIIMRSAGCIINDILDRKIDIHVERTKNRPIADGRIKVREALAIFCILSLIGLWILLQFSHDAVMVGLASMFLLFTYPLAKRITSWPQLYLGLTFNIGIFVAVMNSQHHITLPAIILYIGCIFWTLYYDTLYAFSDLQDDKKIGVKSVAGFLEKRNYKLWLGSFALLADIIISYALILTNHNMMLIIIGALLTFIMMLWQIFTLDVKKMQSCMDRFKYNSCVGMIWAMVALC